MKFGYGEAKCWKKLGRRVGDAQIWAGTGFCQSAGSRDLLTREGSRRRPSLQGQEEEVSRPVSPVQPRAGVSHNLVDGEGHV